MTEKQIAILGEISALRRVITKEIMRGEFLTSPVKVYQLEMAVSSRIHKILSRTGADWSSFKIEVWWISKNVLKKELSESVGLLRSDMVLATDFQLAVVGRIFNQIDLECYRELVLKDD